MVSGFTTTSCHGAVYSTSILMYIILLCRSHIIHLSGDALLTRREMIGGTAEKLTTYTMSNVRSVVNALDIQMEIILF